MTVLVTGGSGHLGANLVRRLLDDGHAVRVLARPESDNSALAEVKSRIIDRGRPSAERGFTPGAVRFLRMGRRADCAKAKAELGYRPSTIAQAVREAFDCFVRRRVTAGSPVSRSPSRSRG